MASKPNMFGGDIPTPDTDDYWLQVAQGVVRRYCGWHVAPSYRETVTLDGNGGRELLMPSMHITEVHSVTVGGVDVTDQVAYGWSDAGVIVFPQRLTTQPRLVEVEMTHGYDATDALEVIELVRAIAGRVQTSTSNVVSQSAGGMSVRYGTNADGRLPGSELMSTEKEILDPYVIEWAV